MASSKKQSSSEKGDGAEKDEPVQVELRAVLNAERKAIKQRRECHHLREPTEVGSEGGWADGAERPEVVLRGLALSGGGIRSARFCLGVLQVPGPSDVCRTEPDAGRDTRPGTRRAGSSGGTVPVAIIPRAPRGEDQGAGP